MSSWPRHPIGEVCDLVLDCVNKTAPTVDGPTAFKMIRTTNVRNGWVDLSVVRHVSADVFASWTRRGVPQRGDVILTREAPLGEVGMLRSDDLVFLGQRLVMYRTDPAKLDSRFLLYVLLGPELQGQIRGLGSGATVAHMRVPDCERLLVPVPSLDTQRAVADVLASFDDLVENSQRRISILEKMAEAIYREWFIRFRFPGHGEVRVVESSRGPVPEGWRQMPASRAIAINPRERVPNDVDAPFFSMADLSETGMVAFPSGTRGGGSGAKFCNGDTLFARITPCLENGKTAWVWGLADGEVAHGSTEFVVLRGKLVGPEFTYLLARSNDFRENAIKSMTGASGRQRIRNECFDSYVLAVPPEPVQRAFEEHVRPMFRTIYALARRNRVLHAARNALLPRLVTGELDVAGRVRASIG